jgi:hypothetical protein
MFSAKSLCSGKERFPNVYQRKTLSQETQSPLPAKGHGLSKVHDFFLMIDGKRALS